MTSELAPVCLRFGVYEMGRKGTIVDRRECNACHGDRCPYEIEAVVAGVCPHCFGTGTTPVGPELQALDGAEAVCVRCGGSGRLH